MKRIIALAALAACTVPAISNAAVVADVAAYGSYVKSSDDSGTPPTIEPKGGGGGGRLRINFPLTPFFVAGEYEQNNFDDDSIAFKSTLKDSRIGLGTEISAGPISVVARAEYVNLALNGDVAGVGFDNNNDGIGVHAGVDAGIGIAGVYGEVGYLRLSDSKGPELTAGARFSIMPLVSLFGEYRYTKLDDRNTGNADTTLNNYRAGVKISF